MLQPTSDLTFGRVLSHALREVRVLRNELSRTRDRESAGNDYAEKHCKYFCVAHTGERCFSDTLPITAAALT